MAGTKCIICREESEGVYTGITCDYDGYLTFMGAMLEDFYSSAKKVGTLISLGDLSELERNIAPNPHQKHAWNIRQDHACVFYGRDKGDYTRGPRKFEMKDFGSSPVYIFKDDRWHTFLHGKLVTVEEALEDYYAREGFPRPKGFYGYLRDEDRTIYKAKYQEELRLKSMDAQKAKAKEALEMGY